MRDPTRRSMLATLALATAGCTGGPVGGSTPPRSTPRSRDSPESSPGSATDDGTAAGDWVERASNAPDPDLSVVASNRDDRARTIGVPIVRASADEVVFETTREVAAGEETELYNLVRADPEGVEAFEICAEPVGSTPDPAPESTTRSTPTVDDGSADPATPRTPTPVDAHSTSERGTTATDAVDDPEAAEESETTGPHPATAADGTTGAGSPSPDQPDDCTRVETSECYGDAIVEIEGESVNVYHAIC